MANQNIGPSRASRQYTHQDLLYAAQGLLPATNLRKHLLAAQELEAANRPQGFADPLTETEYRMGLDEYRFQTQPHPATRPISTTPIRELRRPRSERPLTQPVRPPIQWENVLLAVAFGYLMGTVFVPFVLTLLGVGGR